MDLLNDYPLDLANVWIEQLELQLDEITIDELAYKLSREMEKPTYLVRWAIILWLEKNPQQARIKLYHPEKYEKFLD